MDNTEITAIEWFFGYGGNHLGLKRVIPSLRLIAACEIEAYAVANLVAKMEAGFLDPAPIWTDCKTFPCEPFVDRIDLFVASYPCQGFSAAGQRKGEEDPRYLWPWVRRAIGIIRPRYVFLENVEGHVSLGLREVLTDLVALGYRVENSRGEPTWGIFSAEECGATHRRKRVFIFGELADAEHESRCTERKLEQGRRETESPEQVPVLGGACAKLGDSIGKGLEKRFISDDGRELVWSEGPSFISNGRAGLPASPPGPDDIEGWRRVLSIRPDLAPSLSEAESEVCGVADGNTNRVDRLRLCGNGVYPASAAKAFLTLANRLFQL